MLWLMVAIAAGCGEKPLVSPNGKISVAVDGQDLTVSYGAGVVFEKVHLGLVTEGADLNTGMTLKKVSFARKIVDDYQMVAGKKSACHNEAVERKLTYANPEGGKLTVFVRAYNDGLALRYVTEEGAVVTDDMTSYSIKDGVNRWISPLKTDYESFYPLATDGAPSSERMWPRPAPGAWAYPALVEPAEGVFALISEADLRHGDSASSLSNASDTQVYKVHLSSECAFNGGLSPWRMAIIGELSDIVESTLVTDLSTASQIEDESWIEPGLSSWVYWSNNHGSKDFQIDKEFVDLAVRMGWPYCLVDWEWPEMTNGGSMEDVLAYAKEKGVRINLWYNSGTSWIGEGAPQPQDRLLTAEQREKEMSWLESLGVTGIKVDFFALDGAEMIDYYLDILEDAARHHLLVDFHGCTVPRGWQRTWPNMMSMESVYGAEQYNNGPQMTVRAAAHNATLPFTRNVIGPMDYTPCTFSDSQHPHITTNAHELALPILFESGLQHMADRPSAFDELSPEVKEMLGSLPAAWDETRLLAGYPGESAVIARRSGSKWYVAAINGTDEAVKLPLPLDKLGRGSASFMLFSDSEQSDIPVLGTIADILTRADREINVARLTAPTGQMNIPCRPRGGYVAVIGE